MTKNQHFIIKLNEEEIKWDTIKRNKSKQRVNTELRMFLGIQFHIEGNIYPL